MKKIHWKIKIKKCLALMLVSALLSGMTESPAKVQAASVMIDSSVLEDIGLPEAGLSDIDAETAEWVEAAREELTAIAQEREIMALVYLSDEYPVRVEPSYESEASVTVLSGQMVNIEDVYVTADENGAPELWYYVSLNCQNAEYAGYVPRYHLAVSDQRFLEWEEACGLNLQASAYSISTINNAQSASYADIDAFPESYREALTVLKKEHPNWTFVMMNTKLDWETVIANELTEAKSLVYKSFPDYTKEGLYDSGSWYYASEAVLKQYMDPRNALTENAVFQFELLTYNENYHTEEAVESFLQNTFMNSSGKATGTDMTYAHIFWAVGKTESVSPFHLAARVYQEQGAGTSHLISGNYSEEYKGYYNYFNVGATGKTDKEVIERGLAYAKSNKWTNAYYSILGGTQVISANYILKGQDTLYLQKFNVNPNAANKLYTHQYMQNISAPTSEAKSIKALYESAGSLDNTFVFKIPVYENMPAAACAAPVSSTNAALAVPSGYTDTTVWLDGVPYTAVVRNGQYIVTAPDTAARTAAVYRYSDGVPVGMYLWTLEYKNNAYAVTARPDLTDLLTYHGFSIRITGKSGIRFKTGISADLRSRLTASGVNGYTLKEYGTLVMNNANRSSYPMVLGGEKVLSGMAYGVNASGVLEDNIYETIDGRHRYTSVLVGLPVDQYKVEYAFRGYAILEKDGKSITVYGPVVAKSIYSLADQLLKGGSYAEGTEVYNFLKQLMTDADALQ